MHGSGVMAVLVFVLLTKRLASSARGPSAGDTGDFGAVVLDGAAAGAICFKRARHRLPVAIGEPAGESAGGDGVFVVQSYVCNIVQRCVRAFAIHLLSYSHGEFSARAGRGELDAVADIVATDADIEGSGSKSVDHEVLLVGIASDDAGVRLCWLMVMLVYTH